MNNSSRSHKNKIEIGIGSAEKQTIQYFSYQGCISGGGRRLYLINTDFLYHLFLETATPDVDLILLCDRWDTCHQ